LTFEGVPGLVERRDAYGETTLVVDPARLLEACTYLRNEEGFNFLSDALGAQRLARSPEPKPARFAVNYHLLALGPSASVVRVQVWVDDGQSVESVVSVWPTADWHEREAYDLMGIRFDGHPNLSRIIMEDDWEGHPLRKDYPLGGEPVRFSGAE